MIFNHLQKLGKLVDQDQNSITLNNLSFRYLGLYFTADWCTYCVRLAQELPKLYKLVNSQVQCFKMVTLRLDETPSNFAYNYLRFQNVLLNQISQLAHILQVRSLPSILIYTFDGRLISRDGLRDMRKYQNKTTEYWDKL